MGLNGLRLKVVPDLSALVNLKKSVLWCVGLTLFALSCICSLWVYDNQLEALPDLSPFAKLVKFVVCCKTVFHMR